MFGLTANPLTEQAKHLPKNNMASNWKTVFNNILNAYVTLKNASKQMSHQNRKATATAGRITINEY